LTPLLVAIALEYQNWTPARLATAGAGGRVPSRARSRWGPAARTVGLGFLAGAVYFAGTVYWVAGVVATYGGLPTPVALLVEVLMVASQAIFPALFALLAGRAVRVHGVSGVWLAPFCWVATEWLRATIGFAFPWVMLGSSQSRVLPIVQTASVAGVYGLSWMIALVGSAAAAVTLSRDRRHLWGAAGVALLLAAAAFGGMIRVADGRLLREGEPLRVGLVQGDVEQLAKWDPSYRQPILDRHLELSRRAIGLGARLVIWPESSTPFYFDNDAAWAAPIRRLAAETRTPFVIGSDEFERLPTGDRYYNAAILVGADGRSHGSYRKMQLVPFGEYVPLKRALFFVGPLVEAVSDFSPGSEPRVFDIGAGRRLSVAICYESVYPWISRAFVRHGSQLLAIITNDAWFGRSSAAYQHFDQGAIRAVEEGRYVVRAANTGISGAVDPYGRVMTTTPLFEPEAVTVDVRLLTGQTIYQRFGDFVVWISLAVALAILAGRVPWFRDR
jgi:apolipoprotein N-acyltransferase